MRRVRGRRLGVEGGGDEKRKEGWKEGRKERRKGREGEGRKEGKKEGGENGGECSTAYVKGRVTRMHHKIVHKNESASQSTIYRLIEWSGVKYLVEIDTTRQQEGESQKRKSVTENYRSIE